MVEQHIQKNTLTTNYLSTHIHMTRIQKQVYSNTYLNTRHCDNARTIVIQLCQLCYLYKQTQTYFNRYVIFNGYESGEKQIK